MYTSYIRKNGKCLARSKQTEIIWRKSFSKSQIRQAMKKNEEKMQQIFAWAGTLCCCCCCCVYACLILNSVDIKENERNVLTNWMKTVCFPKIITSWKITMAARGMMLFCSCCCLFCCCVVFGSSILPKKLQHPCHTDKKCVTMGKPKMNEKWKTYNP